MESHLGELRCKEVISVTDGTRYGFVDDLIIDLDSGRVCALLVPGPGRFFFGLLGRREICVIRWEQICRFGPDIILVQGEVRCQEPKKRRHGWLGGGPDPGHRQ